MSTAVSDLGNRLIHKALLCGAAAVNWSTGIYIHKTVIINKLFHCFAAVYCGGKRGEGLEWQWCVQAGSHSLNNKIF
jgi:hypothetical protein